MAKPNWSVIGVGAIGVGVVAFFAHRMGYTQAYKAATTNCQSMIALQTPIQPPTPASEIAGLFGRF